MRVPLARLLLVLALAVPGAPPLAAADLDYTGRAAYFSCGEPWATVAERPPRKGHWYFTEPLSPTVNFLVPCHHVGRPEPWTAAWFDYCQRRWPSFNPRTGFVVTPDGPRRCI